MPLWHQFRDWMHHRWELRRTRRTLLGLTDEQLRDVGLTRQQAETEGERSLHVF
ncbi:DUF1127 domain-containing protein [Aureimonas sp. D3]|uniref:DUF1127 domain-containing protein n=1 Tax=Aureimonas sp. D3 TaxID=1638164 RepID=UPI0009E83DC1|nr:DUF1127 domain-containing protein [Aureimonas sp. D3]